MTVSGGPEAIIMQDRCHRPGPILKAHQLLTLRDMGLSVEACPNISSMMRWPANYIISYHPCWRGPNS